MVALSVDINHQVIEGMYDFRIGQANVREMGFPLSTPAFKNTVSRMSIRKVALKLGKREY